jgi:RNA polymerase sigma factor (sigma-70 family)
LAEPSADLVQRAQRGEPEALTQLIVSQQHYVYSIAMSVLRNAEDAADLTQEAFVRLMVVPHGREPGSRRTAAAWAARADRTTERGR